MELYYLMSITDRDRAEDMAALYRDAGLNLVTTMLGRGTATPQQLALYGLSRTEKAVTGAVVGTDSMKQLFRAAKRKLFIDIPGNGLMLAVPLKSVSSGRTLAYLTDGGRPSGGAGGAAAQPAAQRGGNAAESHGERPVLRADSDTARRDLLHTVACGSHIRGAGGADSLSGAGTGHQRHFDPAA